MTPMGMTAGAVATATVLSLRIRSSMVRSQASAGNGREASVIAPQGE